MGKDVVRRVSGGSRPIPTTGMRGGLGRTLLTALLVLTIFPLGVVGSYALRQNRESLQVEAKRRLDAVASLKGQLLRLQLEELESVFRLSLAEGVGDDAQARARWWHRLSMYVHGLTGVEALDEQGVRWTLGRCRGRRPSESERFAIYYPDRGPNAEISLLVPYEGQQFVFCLAARDLGQVLEPEPGGDGDVYLVYHACVWAKTLGCVSSGLPNAEPQIPANGRYVNHRDVPVIGAYYALPEWHLGILVEQTQEDVLASSDRMAAMFIAMALAVALTTTAIASVVIRQITRPVINLTESAVAMAEGDLDQYVEVKTRDEIGILTYVFNEMAAELKSLYDDLEAKVAERTRLLQKANYLNQRRALHFQTSQKVSQAITSIRDPEELLRQVASLIRDHFAYASVAIYLLEPGGGVAKLRTLSPPGSRWWPKEARAGDGSIIERAVRRRASQVESHQTGEINEWQRRSLSRVAVPLQMDNKVVGVLAVLSTNREDIQEDEVQVLELLSNQIVVALENTRAYERERQAIQQLEEAELFKAHFLANMSHELREPLNTVIGFSRLLLKEIDGPLNEQQRQDLEQIYNDSMHLFFLINDILTISEIQAGLMELQFQPVNLPEVMSGIMPTISALVRGKEIELEMDIPEDLPILRADPARFRQILIHLFSNAAKFTEKGKISLRAWHNEGLVYVSISDTGVGIPPEERERIFSRFEKGGAYETPYQPGAGLGLSLCKEFVEMHGGQIWVESEVGKGSTFTFSIPCYTQFPSDN